MSPSNRVTRSLPVFSAIAGFSRYVELEGYRRVAVRRRSMSLGRGLFNDYFLYKERRRSASSSSALPTPCLPPGSHLSRHTASCGAWSNMDCYSTVRRTCAPRAASLGGGTAPKFGLAAPT